MSIRFKFRSSVNYETVQLEGRDSISVRELRVRIIGGKSFGGVQQPQQGFDLVFADALSCQEYKGDGFQIPTGSSVIVKRVPGGAVPLSVVSPIEAVKDLGMKDSYPLNPANESMDAFDDFDAELCPLPDSNVHHFDLEINKNNLMGNKKKEIDGLRLESQKLDSDVTGPAIPEGNDINLVQETRAKGHLTSNKLITSNFPVAQSSNLPPEMKCALCNTIFKEAVMIPCSQHSFCKNCIRFVLIEEKRCPRCFSAKYNVEDLLPNLSLRQAIEHFLESQMLDAGSEKTMQKDVPDGESRIEAKGDVSCALTKDIKSTLPEQKEKQLHDSRVGYSRRHDIMQRGSEAFMPVADFQGENQLVLPQTNNPGGERNFSAFGGYKKWGRNCYTCGSPDHLMRDCPMSYPSPMFHPGDRSFQGGLPGYAAPYWNGSTMHHFRPFENMYNNPAMMQFNTPMVPVSPFAIPPYFASMHGGLSGPSGHMMMGNMGPPHNAEYFGLQYSENRRKHSNENLRREPLSDDEDGGFPEVYRPNSPEKSHNYKAKKVPQSSLSHSGESFTRRAGGRIKHEKHEESEIKFDERHENNSHSSFPGIDKRPHLDKVTMVKDDVFKISDQHSGGRHRHHHGESEKHHERRGLRDSDSSLGHHSIQKGVKRRVEYDDVRGSHKKHHDIYLESCFERSPDDPRRGCKKRDAGHYYRDSRHGEKILRDKEHGRWQTTSVSGEDRKGRASLSQAKMISKHVLGDTYIQSCMNGHCRAISYPFNSNCIDLV